MTLDVVIVGCGRVAGEFDCSANADSVSHAAAFARNENFRLVGCVDPDKKKALFFAAKHGIRYAGTDLGEIIQRTAPDVVSVTSPDQSHFSIVKQLLIGSLPAPRVIFLEKPACSTMAELEELVGYSRANRIPVIVNHTRRFDPLYVAIKEHFNSGKLGDLLRIDCIYYGGWEHNGIHLVDILRFLFSLEFNQLDVIEKIDAAKDHDTTLTIRASLGEECVPVWFHGWTEQHYQIFDLDFRFSNGRLQVSNFERELVWEKQIINGLGERVLERTPIGISIERERSIDQALVAIHAYCEFNCQADLIGVRLEDIHKSMEALWSKRELEA